MKLQGCIQIIIIKFINSSNQRIFSFHLEITSMWSINAKVDCLGLTSYPDDRFCKTSFPLPSDRSRKVRQRNQSSLAFMTIYLVVWTFLQIKTNLKMLMLNLLPFLKKLQCLWAQSSRQNIWLDVWGRCFSLLQRFYAEVENKLATS